MPRFFFHVDYLLDTMKDPEGSECADLEAAKVEARAIICELAADCLAQDRLFEPASLSISDEAGVVLARVSVAEALTEILPLDRTMPPAID